MTRATAGKLIWTIVPASIALLLHSLYRLICWYMFANNRPRTRGRNESIVFPYNPDYRGSMRVPSSIAVTRQHTKFISDKYGMLHTFEISSMYMNPLPELNWGTVIIIIILLLLGSRLTVAKKCSNMDKSATFWPNLLLSIPSQDVFHKMYYSKLIKNTLETFKDSSRDVQKIFSSSNKIF